MRSYKIDNKTLSGPPPKSPDCETGETVETCDLSSCARLFRKKCSPAPFYKVIGAWWLATVVRTSSGPTRYVS